VRPERKRCGDCQECCVALSIEEIDKPAGTPCSHQCAGGCAIYKARPQACRDYKCVWLQTNMEMDLRPDKCGVILEQRDTKLGKDTVIARETRAGCVDAIWPLIEAAVGAGVPAYAILTTGERRVVRHE
jgi:hypothetical protein